MHWYFDALSKYAVFSGRSRRMEYWMFFLVNVVVSCAILVMERMLGTGNLVGFLYGLAVGIPGIAVAVRRLHDTGRSGWWSLICLIPILGALILVYFWFLDSEPGDNAYGPNPKAIAV